jgi:hypothetical protein
VWLDLAEAGSGGDGVVWGSGGGGGGDEDGDGLAADPHGAAAGSGAAAYASAESRWKLELLRQCLVQEDRAGGGTETPAAARSASSSSSSITERIAEWAANTPWFDDVCVFVAADGSGGGGGGGGSPWPPWRRLAEWLAHARQLHGVPFKAVVVGGAALSSALPPSALASGAVLDLSACASGGMPPPPAGDVLPSASRAAVRRKRGLARSLLRRGSHVLPAFLASEPAARARAAVAAEAFSSDPSRGASDAAVRSGPRRVSGLSLDEERRLQWSLLEPQARRYLGVPPEDDGARADEPCGWPHRLAVHAAKLEIAARLDAILLRPGSGGDAPPHPGSERRFVGDVEQVLRYLERLRARFPRQQPGKRSTGDRQGRLFDSFQDPAWRRVFFSEDRNAAAASSIRHIVNKLIVAVGQLALESALVVRGQVAEAVGEDEEERKVLRAVLHRS